MGNKINYKMNKVDLQMDYKMNKIDYLIDYKIIFRKNKKMRFKMSFKKKSKN
jgi:hypothetical protein